MQATRSTKAASITRIIKVERNAAENCVEASVCETHHKKTKSVVVSFSCYLIRKIDADFGTAVEVEKRFADGELYHIHANDGVSSCDCPAGTYKGKCRHLEMVREAKRMGLL